MPRENPRGNPASDCDGPSEQGGSNEECFSSGPPDTPPATAPPAVPATTPTTAVRVPTEVPAQVAGVTVTRPAPAPAAVPAPLAELPRTGHSFARVGTASAGLTLVLGGLALIGGERRRARRRLLR